LIVRIQARVVCLPLQTPVAIATRTVIEVQGKDALATSVIWANHALHFGRFWERCSPQKYQCISLIVKKVFMTNLVVPEMEPMAALVSRAKAAFDQHLTMPISKRAALLDALSKALQANATRLVAIAETETHLGIARLNGEVSRTCFQLEAFAKYISDTKHLRSVTEEALSQSPPVGRPALELTMVPIGPVAVFAASNFPFAFSVLGGDTAAALAAGCPVIVKSHPAHPNLSLEVFRIAQSVVFEQGLPVDWFSLVSDPTLNSGAELVMQPELAAVSFTGSLRGAKALAERINRRAVPIPFFGELGSINPVIVLPQFLAINKPEVAYALADSIVQGTGQFCTSPGLILISSSKQADAFVASLAQRLDLSTTHQMLTKAMRSQFEQLVAKAAAAPNVRILSKSQIDNLITPLDENPRPTLHEVSLSTFISHPELRDEIFGPYALIVRINSGINGFIDAIKACEGSLTTTFWATADDRYEVRSLLPLVMQKAGRVLFSGVPTGVAVTEAQHHGGPWPASTRPESTSVGMRAIERFTRPVALQDVPFWLNEEMV
jgi:NADP-dependent aldehyde dehydrogenase